MKENYKPQKTSFKIHPRVFSALGADLVTNDVVAIIELVKNSYDAYATRVDIRFGRGGSGERWMEVEDNGSGMTDKIIKNVWCTVATPYRQVHKYGLKGRKQRRVSGEKGLGRLATARLGRQMEVETRASNSPCWQFGVDWKRLAKASSVGSYAIPLARATSTLKANTGTKIRVSPLHADWDEDKVADLKENLSRLISPFQAAQDFEIFFTEAGANTIPVKVSPPKFIDLPPYLIKGALTPEGTLSWEYKYAPAEGNPRAKSGELQWDSLAKTFEVGTPNRFLCGPFSFEVRSWDIGHDEIEEIADRFELPKSSVRKAIKAFKGISVYRDGVLVLPKSDTARDWLGLDLRRVSKVGTRLSTSQIVGYAAISAQVNPDIEDTSDRERLVTNDAVAQFQEVIKAAVSVLENQRDHDRRRNEPPLKELFAELSAKKLLEEVGEVASAGGQASEVLPAVVNFEKQIESAREQIERRFVYYSRLATVGTIAQMLVHEIGNKTLVIGKLVGSLADYPLAKEPGMARQLELANAALGSLGQLAQRFSPLASRSYQRRGRTCIAEEIIADVVETRLEIIKRHGIAMEPIPNSQTELAVDPGELYAVILNLVDNAIFWLGEAPKEKRLEIQTWRTAGRLNFEVNDSGPGVPPRDEQRVFLPGVTSKPNGIGMGLTVASELVAEYQGRMALVQPGVLGGASFTFDLPIAEK